MPSYTRSELARKIARFIGRKRLPRTWQLRELLDDCESVAFELEATAPPGVTSASIAWKAVQRVRCGRQHRESIRSITTGRHDRRSKRPDLRQAHIRLTDVASRDTAPSDAVPGWIDFQTWASGYTGKKRDILEALAVGGTTSETATAFSLSRGRISQYRDEFRRSYGDFQS
jgi:hypothetical protein